MSAPAAVADGTCRSAPAAADCRCLCGSLLARWVERGVELKCRRCKRTLLVPFPDGGASALPTASRPIPVGEIG